MTTTANLGRCTATTARGDPCGAYACSGSEWCFWHDPSRAEDRAEARRRGGLARHGRSLAGAVGSVEIREVRGVLSLLERAVSDVFELESSIARARTVGYLVGVALRALELSELEARVAALEAKR